MIDPSAYTTIGVAIENAVLTLTLDRPHRMNALTDCMVDELRQLFSALYLDHSIRVVVMKANGRNFCAGLDVKERDGGLPTTSLALLGQRKISEIVIAMRRCQQPIVALVQGAASGGGFALALASDIRILSADARMNAAFIRIGLGGCDIGVSYFLPRMIGSSLAAKYLLTGRFISAQDAIQFGLAADVVPADELERVASSYVADLLRATPIGLRLTKEALNHAIDAPGLEAVVALEDRNQILCSQSGNFREGIAAFLEKRQPNYLDE
jgi:enoyl-CoA hydratase/carnithine racemase